MDCYDKAPIKYSETGIPIFSSEDDYTTNYEKIATDHLVVERETSKNPWITDELRIQFEESTYALVKKHLSDSRNSGIKVLDVGVALGRLLDMVDGVEKFGVDISMGYLEIAQKKGIEVCCARAEELPYKKCYFDMVICTDVLEHVFNLNRTVESLLSVIKPGGILIVRAPLNELLRGYFDDEYPYEYVHMRTFDLWSLKALFEKIYKQRILEYSVVQLPHAFTQELFFKWINIFNLMRRVTNRLLRIVGRGPSKIKYIDADEFRQRLSIGEINVVLEKR